MALIKLASFGSLQKVDRVRLMAGGMMPGGYYELCTRADMVMLSSYSVYIAVPLDIWNHCIWE